MLINNVWINKIIANLTIKSHTFLHFFDVDVRIVNELPWGRISLIILFCQQKTFSQNTSYFNASTIDSVPLSDVMQSALLHIAASWIYSASM